MLFLIRRLALFPLLMVPCLLQPNPLHWFQHQNPRRHHRRQRHNQHRRTRLQSQLSPNRHSRHCGRLADETLYGSDFLGRLPEGSGEGIDGDGRSGSV